MEFTATLLYSVVFFLLTDVQAAELTKKTFLLFLVLALNVTLFFFFFMENHKLGRLHVYRLIKAVFSCTGFWEGWREGGGGCSASCVLWRFVTLRGAGVQRNVCLLQSVREAETCKGCPNQKMLLDELLNSSLFIQIDIMKWMYLLDFYA